MSEIMNVDIIEELERLIGRDIPRFKILLRES